MPCGRKNENVFGEMLAIWILCEVIAEVRYNGDICMAMNDVSISKPFLFSSEMAITYITDRGRAQNDLLVSPHRSPSRVAHYETTAAPWAA